jgi:hypothetical protein
VLNTKLRSVCIHLLSCNPKLRVQINPFALGALWLQRSSLRSGGNVPVSIPVSGSFRTLKSIEYYLRMRRPSHILWLTFDWIASSSAFQLFEHRRLLHMYESAVADSGYNNELRRD